MISNLFKVALIAGALLLSACSGASTHSEFSEATLPSAGFGPGPTNNPNKMSFHGSALGNSFGEYSSGLLHDD
jgi:ABC-type glycerol-3-phosphate transport system substrate-binding protein